ncbi:MAG: gliding motility-associated C-terminal domain-containing protein [Cytophagia bacterium]|nr:gliding motility-associated C-terminal domain-containing protein [Cytophagia bacterium]
MLKKLTILTLLILFISIEAKATHIRAGELTAVRISQSSLRYRFTLIIYRDTESSVRVGDGGIMNFGQQRILNGRAQLLENSVSGDFQITNVGNQTERVVIEWEHTFDGPGVYVVSYTENNRNANIINLGGGASDTIPFHVETIIRIDPGLGVNGTPQLTNPPIDRACVGARFIHNAGAYDPDGDSLAYKIVVPLQDRGTEAITYRSLDDPDISTIRENATGPTQFTIDPITGDLVWDAPEFAGEYNLAFIIEEWRYSTLTQKYELLGYVTRDMQVLVEDCDNERPQLEIPADTCIVAGSLLESQILGLDPDNNNVLVEAFGGPMVVNNSPAQLFNLPEMSEDREYRPQPSEHLLSWQTNFTHIRERPYSVLFKITDEPNDPDAPRLTDFKTWNIRVVAPAPTGLSASILTGQSIGLNWDNYVAADLNPTIEIYRRTGSYDFEPKDCNLGIPANSGYEKIDEVSVNETTYTDSNDLRPGVNYCYRIVAKFPAPEGGTSYASTEFCVLIPLDVPAITNVSVQETSDTNGEIYVRWAAPLDIDQTLFPPPYTYELIRYTGMTGSADRTLLTTTQDTVYTDVGLNTFQNPYHYQVRFYDAGNNLIDSSATASSVRLNAVSEVKAIDLDWSANVPWSLRVQDSPYHYIFRNRTDPAADDIDNFVLIDSVMVTTDGLTYYDDGSFNGVELLDDRFYCYYISTYGSYNNPNILSPLINDSQKLCVQPNDQVPPKKPEIYIDPDDDPEVIDGPDGPLNMYTSESCGRLDLVPCGYADFTNTINWTSDPNDSDIAYYNIYFSSTGAEADYSLVGTSLQTSFQHTGLASVKGCYKVSAVDRSQNESELSASICFDNCPYYELPNTFTPNGDGVNDTFRAFDQPNGKCPRFVKSVSFKVFDRWGGKEIFSYTTEGITEPNFFIDWDGRGTNGVLLPDGVYYYTATVTFDVLDERKRVQEFKNWVKIVGKLEGQ